MRPRRASISVSSARRQWAALLANLEHSGRPVVIERHGRPIAVLSPYAERVLPPVEYKPERGSASAAPPRDDGGEA